MVDEKILDVVSVFSNTVEVHLLGDVIRMTFGESLASAPRVYRQAVVLPRHTAVEIANIIIRLDRDARSKPTIIKPELQ